MLEILQNIMKMSNDKRSTLLFFLDDNTQNKVQKYNMVEKEDLYLKNSLIFINKMTLEIEYEGIIEYMKDDKITIRKNNYHRNIEPNNYYIFIKKDMSKKDSRKFFEELLKKL
jgi:hypothetical protein